MAETQIQLKAVCDEQKVDPREARVESILAVCHPASMARVSRSAFTQDVYLLPMQRVRESCPHWFGIGCCSGITRTAALGLRA